MWSPQVTCNYCQSVTRKRFDMSALREGWVGFYKFEFPDVVNEVWVRIPDAQLTEPTSHHIHICPDCVLQILGAAVNGEA